MELKINFTDFWYNFDKTESSIYKLLSKHYQVVFSDEPDILFYSCYGRDYLKYDCIRVFYTAENVRPDFTGCDYAISFDHINRENHFRFPLYGFYIDHQYYSGSRTKNLEELTAVRSKEELMASWNSKTKFCCMVVSNDKSKKRLNFFNKLSAIRQVDSGGRTMNNIGGPVHDKLSFIKDYKFVMAFENDAYPGYTTEKPIEPMMVDCIPLYWGNPEVAKDINPRRLLNYDDFDSEDAMIEKMLAIDKDPSLALEILEQPVFPGNKVPEYIKSENLLQFLDKIIASKDFIKPVALSYKRYIHLINRKKLRFKNSLMSRMGKATR